MFIGICTGFFVLLPFVAMAATASPEAVLKAVREAERNELCRSSTQQVGSDCQKTTVRCDGGTGSGWADYVERHYRSVGGTVQTIAPSAIVTTEVDPISRTPITRTVASTEQVPTDALDYLRADWQRNRVTAPGPIQRGSCYCACGEGDNAGACAGKSAGFPIQAGSDLTYEQCVVQCGARSVATSKCSIQPIAPALVGTAASTAGLDSDAWCFTPAQCAEQNGFFEEHAECGDRGRCYAAEPPVQLQVPLGNVTEVQGLNRYILAAYRYGVSIVAVAATVMFVYGAFLYLVGSAITAIDRGKTIMQEAILGMIFVFAAVMILRTINPATMNLNPLKVYMVNTRQFIQTAQCVDLGQRVRVAAAGLQPNVTPYEVVASRENAFDTVATNAECGQTYWVEGAENNSCEGSACPAGESCVSCADGDLPGCGGVANDRRTCVRTIFAGSIDYVDARYPLTVDLVGVCVVQGGEMEPEVLEEGLQIIQSRTPSRVGRRTGGQVTEEDEVGRATYVFDYDVDDLQEAVDYCNERFEGFRGVALAVTYKESLSAVGFAYDDLALLSPTNCRASQFDGYANGIRGEAILGNEEEISHALVCGRARGAFQDAGSFWSHQQLQAAAKGGAPIVCNFSLSDANAPTDPEGRYCR